MTRKYGGSGLGLSIVKALVQLMRGFMDVKTQVDAGSLFTVVLLVHLCEESSSQVSEEILPRQPIDPSPGKRTSAFLLPTTFGKIENF